MKSTLILDYYAMIQKFRLRNDKKALLAFVEEQQAVLGLIPRYTELMKGERAYYNQQYAAALKHYLSAEEAEDRPFFCYRASAFVYFEQGELAKSLGYAKKALHEQPKDFDTLQLLYQLLDAVGSRISDEDEEPSSIFLRVADNELEDLTRIF